MSNRWWLAAALAAGVTACGEDAPEAPATGEGLFLNGCPVPGRSFARVLTDAAETPQGPNALAAPGDVLIANERAAFVVTRPGAPRTYYYYGGILVDAVAVDGCRQAALERFGELALLVGTLNLGDFPQSTLRGFKGERVEVVNDGADGKAAVVRVHGVDDKFWLVDMELQRKSWEGGKKKLPSPPLGVRFDVDYVLAPGSSVLELVLRFENLGAEARSLLAGGALFLGDTTPMPELPFFPQRIAAGGFGVGYGAPWIVAGEGAGSYAFALDSDKLGNTNISGVNALIDVTQALEKPIALAPAGQPGATQAMSMYVSVGATDKNSATRALAAMGLGGRESIAVPLAGKVHEPDGTPVDDARVDVQRKDSTNRWATIDELRTDTRGVFAGSLPDYGDGKPWRLVAKGPGRTPSAPVEVTLPVDLSNVDFTLLQAGGLGYVVQDEAGKPLPAKLTLVQPGEDGADREVRRLYTVDGRGEARVEPGRYRVFVTRGMEYEVVELDAEVKPAQSAPVNATLRRLVDTAGFLSIDGHVHQAPSEDSTVTVAQRMDTFAAEGVEVMIATDHEIIDELAASPEARRLAAYLSVLNGEEVTASSPEHTNMWGVEVDRTRPRGGPVKWYGKGLAEIFAAERARGAKLVSLNHPREDGGCSWLCAIDWDRLTGLPRVTDPEIFGLAPGSSMWSWDFDAVELLNGMKDIFLREDPRRSGKFDDWLAFHNLGHRIVGVGVTDTHDDWDVGSPRNYFAAPTDDPAAFEVGQLERAVKAGQVLVSTGAFARLTVDGRGLGETVAAENGAVALKLRVEAIPQVDVDVVKVFANCDEVLTLDVTDRDQVVKLDVTRTLPLAKDAHVVVVGWGERPMPHGLIPTKRATPRFVTNPVYVDADGGGYTPPGGKTCTYTAPR
jgi:hypothetical protein